MKKIFTLAALLVVALSVSAQGYRKWDFTSWSAQTVANLQAEDAAGGVSDVNGHRPRRPLATIHNLTIATGRMPATFQTKAI